jgi:NAD-dependent deacetylase sirtuin 4
LARVRWPGDAAARPPGDARGSGSVVPEAPPPSDADVAALSRFIDASRRLLVLTGAGISTESGLADYRSPNGAYSRGHKPMTHQEFVSGPQAQRRYWLRSMSGWTQFAERSRPNAAHAALAAMQRAGRLSGGLITQNVDRLHQAAGATDVLELHGTTHRVHCLQCGADSCRRELQTQLQSLNPGVLSAAPGGQRPDGDAEVAPGAHEAFALPQCASCGGGPLKPAVVFFGASLEPDVAARSLALAAEADAVLVIGSSLSTRSALRLAEAAAKRGAPVALLNVGPSRADALAALRIEARAAEALPRALAHGGLDLPHLGAAA